jgi:predicted ArsR family transcriptional regulator
MAVPASEPLLFRLKTAGPLQADQLAALLGITPQAVRQQLDRLLAAGLVEHEDRIDGPGRPKRHWSLSETGHARFPDSHAQLTVGLIEAMRAEFGEAGLDRLIQRREAELNRLYRDRLADKASLAEKVAALAELRAAEGYMARWSDSEDGFLLIEDHCPICAAARSCQGFCRSELALFAASLGPSVRVERIDHLLAGGRRCAYRIAPVVVADPAAV